MSHLRFRYLVPLIVLALTSMASGQDSASQMQLSAGPTYTNDSGKNGPRFPAVDIVVELRAKDGHPVQIHPGDLKLYSLGEEIGSSSGILPFERTGYGMTSILAIDASGAIRGVPEDAMRRGIVQFVTEARPQDQVAALTLAEQSQTNIPFGTDHASLAQAINSVQSRGRSTKLFDGMLTALAMFTRDQPQRRQLLLISDGQDGGSSHTLADVMFQAKSLGVVVDCIGVGNAQDEALNTLQAIAVETGGAYIRLQNAQQLPTLIATINAMKRASPVATFTLAHVATDGRLLSTQLRWQPGNLSTAAFIQLPTGNPALNNFRKFSDVWFLSLGSCFFAGVILLLLSVVPVRESNKFPSLPQFVVTIRNGQLAGTKHQITSAVFAIGAAPGNDLQVPGDATISGRHLSLYSEIGQLHVEDNKSTNGTYLNGARLPAGRHRLNLGDVISIGQTSLMIERT